MIDNKELNKSHFRRLSSLLLCSFVTPYLYASPVTSPTSSSKEQKKALVVEPKSGEEKGILRKWLAMGSGCGQSASNASGPISLKSEMFDASQNLQVAQFAIDQFDLDSEKLKSKNWHTDLDKLKKEKPGHTLRIPAECSIRLAVHPPEGMKISSIKARWGFKVAKNLGTGTKQEIALILGDSTMDTQTLEQKSDDSLKKEQHFGLESAISSAHKKFPKLNCAEPKLVGADLKFFADVQSSENLARLSADNEPFKMEVMFEKCIETKG
jgi:hypothetical protein